MKGLCGQIKFDIDSVAPGGTPPGAATVFIHCAVFNSFRFFENYFKIVPLSACYLYLINSNGRDHFVDKTEAGI